MKRFGALIFMLALCLLATSALAEGVPVARGDDIAAYVDGQGSLFLAGRDDPINNTDADSVVAVDAYRALFYCPDNFLGTNDLYMIDLETFKETLVAQDVYDAALTDDTAWYVTNADRKTLKRVDLISLASKTATVTTEPIDRLYASNEGLIVDQVDQTGTLLYVRETDRFEDYTEPVPLSGFVVDGDEVYLTDAGRLYLRSGFNYTSLLIDSDVTAFTRLNDAVYYLVRTGNAV